MNKNILTFTLLVASIFISGCASHTDKTQLGKSEHNILGIIKYEEAAYSPVGVNTFGLSKNELAPVANYSGDKVTLLWGLFTLNNY